MDSYEIFDELKNRGLISPGIEKMVTEDVAAGEPESGISMVLSQMREDGVRAPDDILDAIDSIMEHGWPPYEWCIDGVKRHRAMKTQAA